VGKQAETAQYPTIPITHMLTNVVAAIGAKKAIPTIVPYPPPPLFIRVFLLCFYFLNVCFLLPPELFSLILIYILLNWTQIFLTLCCPSKFFFVFDLELCCTFHIKHG